MSLGDSVFGPLALMVNLKQAMKPSLFRRN
jgi:hypothetical protein